MPDEKAQPEDRPRRALEAQEQPGHLPSDPLYDAETKRAARPGVLPNASSELPETPPVEVPNHSLLRCLGSGGFGQVWLGRHTVTEHYRACKLIPESRSLELDGLKRLKQRVPAHPHLFPIEEVGISDGWLYCLMPLARGAAGTAAVVDVAGYVPHTLELHIKRQGRLATAEVAQIGCELADALGHLHEHGVTHGDVKPGNVLRRGEAWTLADYGLLRDIGAPTGPGHTPGYAPPEGPGSQGADQFALGVLLFELLTAQPAQSLPEFRSRSIEPPRLGDRAPALREIILRATAAKPEERFGSMRELADALRRDCAQRRSRRWMIATAAVAVVAVVVTIVVVVSQLRDSTPSTATVQVESFEVRHYRYDGDEDVTIALGRLGHDTDTAVLDDYVQVDVRLSAPAYMYILSLDTNGKVTIRVPDTDTEPPPRSDSLLFPADPDVYHLTDGPGTQAFVLIASAEELPPWAEWTANHGAPTWPAATGPTLEGVWVYDGTGLAPARPDRGEIVRRRGEPRFVIEVVDWAKRRAGTAELRVVAFPVLPMAR